MFVDDVLLLAPLSCDFQLLLDWVQCDAVGQIRLECPRWVGSKVLPQVMSLSILVLPKRNKKMEQKMTGRWVLQLRWRESWATRQDWKTEEKLKTEFPHRVAGFSHRDRERSSPIWKRFRVELLHLSIRWSQLKWFGHLIKMHPGHMFWTCPNKRRTLGGCWGDGDLGHTAYGWCWILYMQRITRRRRGRVVVAYTKDQGNIGHLGSASKDWAGLNLMLI